MTDQIAVAPASGWSRFEAWASTVTIALLYGLATMVAADQMLQLRVAEQAVASPFASEAVFLTYLRVAVFGVSLLFSLLQAGVYVFLLAAVARVARPRLSDGWRWLLVSQIPFIVLVGASYVGNGADGTAWLQQIWSRLALGVVCVVIFCALARRATGASAQRLVSFAVLATALNSGLLLLTAGN